MGVYRVVLQLAICQVLFAITFEVAWDGFWQMVGLDPPRAIGFLCGLGAGSIFMWWLINHFTKKR